MAYELFVDSFDTDVSAGRWVFFQGNQWSGIDLPSAGNGRHGSASARLNNVFNGASGFRSQYLASSTHLVVGAAVRRNQSTNFALLGLLSTTTGGPDVRLGSIGLLEYYRGSGSVVTTDYAVDHNAWYYLELGVVIGASGSLEIRVNGATVVFLSGVDTRPSGSASTCNAAQLYMTGGGVDFEDFYIAYGDELKWLGDIRVDALALTADTTPQDWTPDTGNAWERLNATAGYITGTTLGDESRFEMADYTAVNTAIHGIQVAASARKTDAGSRSFAIEIDSGGTVDVGDTVALGDTAVEYRQSWVVDPDTSAAWTDGGLDALKLGVKVID